MISVRFIRYKNSLEIETGFNPELGSLCRKKHFNPRPTFSFGRRLIQTWTQSYKTLKNVFGNFTMLS